MALLPKTLCPRDLYDVQHLGKTNVEENCMTLSRFILSMRREHIHLSQLLNIIQTIVKSISNAVRKVGLDTVVSASPSKHDALNNLFAYADNLFGTMLIKSRACCSLSSTHSEYLVNVEEPEGQYIVLYDPLDGRRNMDIYGLYGSTFAIYRRKKGNLGDVLQAGNQLVAAGYALYASSTTIVFTNKYCKVVLGFTLDPSIGEFLLTEPDIRIGPTCDTYCLNEGSAAYWDPAITQWLNIIKNSKEKQYQSRCTGTLVADVHRCMKFGGIILCPTSREFKANNLHLMHKCVPLGYLMVRAGGKATNGQLSILDITPSKLHERSQLFVGSSNEINSLLSILSPSLTTPHVPDHTSSDSEPST